jgi:hypothetical protein
VRPVLRSWHAAAALFTICALVLGGIWYWRTRPARSARDLVARAWEKDAILVYVDLQTLRNAGVLSLLTGARAEEDPEYVAFAAGTGFDYRRDLDSVLFTVRPNETIVLATGRFDWPRLTEFERLRGGSCLNGICGLEESVRNRPHSFMSLRGGAFAFGTVPNHLLPSRVSPRAVPAWPFPDAPFWVAAPRSALARPLPLPDGLRGYQNALREANPAIFWLSGGRNRGFELNLNAVHATPAAAAATAARLTEITGLLSKLIAREGRQPLPEDLASVLLSGVFQTEGAAVKGRWEVPLTFVNATLGSAL